MLILLITSTAKLGWSTSDLASGRRSDGAGGLGGCLFTTGIGIAVERAKEIMRITSILRANRQNMMIKTTILTRSSEIRT